MAKRCEIAFVNHAGREPEFDLNAVQGVVDSALAEDRMDHCLLTVLFVDDAESAKLHAKHFDDADPTDVMTFPDGSIDPETGLRHLGDLAVGLDVASRIARERGRSEADEVCLYILHGLLHLLGHDDEDDADQRAMWQVQRRLLQTVGIAIEEHPQ
ncbi:MAG: rRNA maturation RNase YbeY [Planctomycetes bacterium]|nr:rRNA maturation RNase YbeY [Planctomycetota bacterium]